MDISLFPLTQYWWLYGLFTGFVFLVLAIDLGIFHRKAHAVSFREAAIWSVIWVTIALIFNGLLYQYSLWQFSRDPRLLAIPGFNAPDAAKGVALEFFTGYVLEKSLSVDNIFIFVLVFSFFAIPAIYQHRVLFYGILGALLFRAIFIALGAALVQYQWVLILFGIFLILTGVKMLFAKDKEMDLTDNWAVKLFKKHLPVTNELHGEKFFVKIDGKKFATPLMLALVFLEMTDVVFAVDSVPAIYSITQEPLIVFTSNIFAILGLRSLYFMLAGAVEKFYLLKYGLAIVLVFVGLKMTWLNKLFDGHFPITYSLGIILGVITLSIVISLIFPKSTAKPIPASDNV